MQAVDPRPGIGGIVEQPALEQFGDNCVDPGGRLATVGAVETDRTLGPAQQNTAQIGRRRSVAVDMR